MVSGGSHLNAGTGTITFAPTVTSSTWAALIVGIKPPAGSFIWYPVADISQPRLTPAEMVGY